MPSPIAQISLQEFHPLETKGYVYFFDFDLLTSEIDISSLVDSALVVFLYSSVASDFSLRESMLNQGCIFWRKESDFEGLGPASKRQRLLLLLQGLYSGLKATDYGFYAK
jgi:hypothetical protein